VSEDHELIHQAAAPCDAVERTDAEIIADWCRGLDALFAHGVEDALPPGPIRHRWTSPAPVPSSNDEEGIPTSADPISMHDRTSADDQTAAQIDPLCASFERPTMCPLPCN
jgi:hypothetical protein